MSRKKKASEANKNEGDGEQYNSKSKKMVKSEFVKEKEIEKELKQLKQTVEDMRKINQISTRMSEEDEENEDSINFDPKAPKKRNKMSKSFKFELGQKLSNLCKTDLIKVARMLENIKVNCIVNGRFSIDLDTLQEKVWVKLDKFINEIINENKKISEKQSKNLSDISKKKNEVKTGLLIRAKHNIIKPSISNQKYVEELIKQTKDTNLSDDSQSSSSESSNIQESNNDNALERLRQRNELFNSENGVKQSIDGVLGL